MKLLLAISLLTFIPDAFPIIKYPELCHNVKGCLVDYGRNTGWWRMKESSRHGACNFKGYKPAGNAVSITQIKAPTAKLENQVLVSIFETASAKTGQLSNGVEKFVEYYDKAQETSKKIAKAFKVLGYFGKALGITSTVFGFLEDKLKPSPGDIIDSVNKAVTKLTDEVNLKFDQMKGYVDQKILDLQRSMMTKRQKELYHKWVACSNFHTSNDVRRCLRYRYGDTDGAKYTFLLYFDKRNLWDHQNRPTITQVKEIEVGFLIFREYALLKILQLETLVKTFEKRSTPDEIFYYEHYVKKTSTDVTELINYAKFAYKWIEDLHSSRYTCAGTLHCSSLKKFNEGWWVKSRVAAKYATCRCKIHPLESSFCNSDIWVRQDYVFSGGYKWEKTNARNSGGAVRELAQIKFREAYTAYKDKALPVVKEYWKKSVMDLLPTWKKIRDDAEKRKEKI